MKIRKIITTVSGIMMAAFLMLPTNAWTGNNKHYITTETIPISLYKTGHVQIQPSINDGGYHYARGIIDYLSDISVGTVYTAFGRSASDSRIYSKSHTLLNFDGFKCYNTRFSFRSNKVAHGSSYWPV